MRWICVNLKNNQVPVGVFLKYLATNGTDSGHDPPPIFKAGNSWGNIDPKPNEGINSLSNSKRCLPVDASTIFSPLDQINSGFTLGVELFPARLVKDSRMVDEMKARKWETIAMLSEATAKEFSASSEEMSAQVEEVTASAQELEDMAKILKSVVARSKFSKN
jgi:hypothetical protein